MDIMIGQVDVGAYFTSDMVQVVSQNNVDGQYIWASATDGSFTVLNGTETVRV